MLSEYQNETLDRLERLGWDVHRIGADDLFYLWSPDGVSVAVHIYPNPLGY